MLCPIVLAQGPMTWQLAKAFAFAVLALSLTASSGYLLNDLADRAADRRHPEKRFRPIASGKYPGFLVLAQATVLLLAAFGIAGFVGGQARAEFTRGLEIYFLVSLVYTLWGRQVAAIDVCLLSAFYTWRLYLGAVIAGVSVSPTVWVFSALWFLSLALLKRASEIKTLGAAVVEFRPAYRFEALPVVMGVGWLAGVLALVTLGFFLQSEKAIGQYAHPIWLTGVSGGLALWWGNLWRAVWLGRMGSDPLVFAAQDVRSQVLAGVVLAVFARACGWA